MHVYDSVILKALTFTVPYTVVTLYFSLISSLFSEQSEHNEIKMAAKLHLSSDSRGM